MLGNLNFGDFATRLDSGIGPEVASVGTISGAAVPLTATARNFIFRLMARQGTAAGTATLTLQTASASSGPWTAVAGISAAVTTTTAAVPYEAAIDTSNVAFCDIGTGVTFVQPVVVIATTATPICLDVLGYGDRALPATFENSSDEHLVTTLFRA